jgi:hypothetical protein
MKLGPRLPLLYPPPKHPLEGSAKKWNMGPGTGENGLYSLAESKSKKEADLKEKYGADLGRLDLERVHQLEDLSSPLSSGRPNLKKSKKVLLPSAPEIGFGGGRTFRAGGGEEASKSDVDIVFDDEDGATLAPAYRKAMRHSLAGADTYG